jgi:hypothetical protein
MSFLATKLQVILIRFWTILILLVRRYCDGMAQFNLVTSTYVHIAAAPGAVPPYDGAMLINSASQGDASGLDFVSIADGSNDGMLLLYREDRTTNDGYAEILMNQASADGFHRMLFEVKEGIEGKRY